MELILLAVSTCFSALSRRTPAALPRAARPVAARAAHGQGIVSGRWKTETDITADRKTGSE